MLTPVKRPARASRPKTVSGAPSPKTTRPEALSRRQDEPKLSTAEKLGRDLDAFPDRIDVRDWFYRPRLEPLPDQIVNCDSVPAILDQGREGACTGFALAAVINYLLAARNRNDRRASPRMLYHMARRYDEWPGENYSGSSARGAMKGWVAHGVCHEENWPKKIDDGPGDLTPALAQEALESPGGAYYRVMHRQVRDMHAALQETGILYATLMVHAGWDKPRHNTDKTLCDGELNYVENGNVRKRPMPVIMRQGRADGGHAVAIVGYTRQGFIIQNSWGPEWGAGGFALLPYEDWLLHATDVWVAQLGVPLDMNVWREYQDVTTAGIHRAISEIPLADIRPYVVDVGNNGELSDSGTYWTTEADLARLFSQEIRDATKSWKKKRVLLYLHGGLNDEKAVARRIVAFRDVFLANEIYPLHIMWESGAGESIRNIIADTVTDDDERSEGVSEWLRKAREGLIEAKDRTFELTISLPGSALWAEMKENAALASSRAENGGIQLLAKHVKQAMARLSPAEKAEWQLHIVGHSAGSIFAAHAIPHLLALGITLKTLNFLAPAIRVDTFLELLGDLIKKGRIPQPACFVLSNDGELDDDVGPYGKSLLYLVSNSFEGRRGVPLLGMEKYLTDPKHQDAAVAAVSALFAKPTAEGLPSLVIAGANGPDHSVSRSDSHGGFDNDPATLNALLCRMRGAKSAAELPRKFEVRDLQF